MKRQEFVRRVCRGVLSAVACVAMATGAQAETKDVDYLMLWGFRYVGVDGHFGGDDRYAGQERKTAKGCERITTTTTTLKDDGWYYVEGHVELDHGLVLEGEVGIILMNGSRLVIRAKDNTPGIAVRYGATKSDELVIYGQEYEPALERGTLEVYGGKNAAGIGGLCEKSHSCHCGKVYIYGGHIIAHGGENAAGIGGSHFDAEYSGYGPEYYDQSGGHVEAFGGRYASGVGAARYGTKSCRTSWAMNMFFVRGGVLEATGGEGRYAIGAYSIAASHLGTNKANSGKRHRIGRQKDPCRRFARVFHLS